MMWVWRISSLHLETGRLVVDLNNPANSDEMLVEYEKLFLLSFFFFFYFQVSGSLWNYYPNVRHKAFSMESIGVIVSSFQFMNLVSKALFVDKCMILFPYKC